MMKTMIWEDLCFFVNSLKNLKISESLIISESGSFCVSTGTESENWVYCPEEITSPEMVNMAVSSPSVTESSS